jgi:diacylglycerol kinase family enzyme
MLKRTIGPSVYIAAGFAVFRRGGFDSARPSLRITLPDGTQSPPLLTVITSNSSPFTYLGSVPMVIAPGADYDRPLEIFGLRRMEFVHTLRLVVSSFAGSGLLRRSPQVWRTSSEVAVIESDVPFDVQVDGEYRGERTRIELGWEPAALDVYC